MKSIRLYLGQLGCGKSHIAKQECKKENGHFIETSALVSQVATKYYSNPTREQLQKLKFQLQEDPRWLIDLLLQEIENTSKIKIFISGLREVSLYQELNALFGIDEIVIVIADDELRRQRRELSHEQFVEASKRDDSLGLSDLLELVKPKARIVYNNFELVKR